MTTLAFDTHEIVKELTKAGFTEAQAEAVTRAVKKGQDVDLAHLATKADLAETKADLLKGVFGALAAQTAFLSAIKFFGH